MERVFYGKVYQLSPIRVPVVIAARIKPATHRIIKALDPGFFQKFREGAKLREISRNKGRPNTMIYPIAQNRPIIILCSSVEVVKKYLGAVK